MKCKQDNSDNRTPAGKKKTVIVYLHIFICLGNGRILTHYWSDRIGKEIMVNTWFYYSDLQVIRNSEVKQPNSNLL